MAKAVFHKGQRVYVKPVATWAVIEQVHPQWVKGVEEPLRVTYDTGLGRDFQAHELAAEEKDPHKPDLIETENWRVLRAVNRLSQEARDPRHPYPGTYPVVVTDEQDWGGWRVPWRNTTATRSASSINRASSPMRCASCVSPAS
jgi:hypothetical protein